MAKVLTFSRHFPAYHPKAGAHTYFVEQIWNGLNQIGLPVPKNSDLPKDFLWSILPLSNFGSKFHTIRAGKHWKVGDKFSPRVWSGKPYASKQIIFAPDIEVKKVYDFEMVPAAFWDECRYYINDKEIKEKSVFSTLAQNDGLEPVDFALWFAGKNMMDSKRKPFSGQVICWDETVEY